MSFGRKKHDAAIQKSINAIAGELGKQAFHAGVALTENPLKGGAYGFNAWANGWEWESLLASAKANALTKAQP